VDARRRIKVFVFLAEGFGATRWRNASRSGGVPGVNDILPYGYYHAATEAWSITHSEDGPDFWLRRLVQRALRKILGFDLIHAWHNREQLTRADIVWTHTEREYLAALSLWGLRGLRPRPMLLAQTVWLFDRWHNFSVMRREFYRRLIRQADLLTTLSSENLSVARRLFPEKRCELVRFGLDISNVKVAQLRRFHTPIRIASLGTDIHRDWGTLIDALGDWHRVETRVAGLPNKHRPASLNLMVAKAKTAQAVTELYEWADLVVIALKPNLHASGITVILEAVGFGLPVICTDTGGLRTYFSDEEIGYVEPRNPKAIREKVEEFAADDEIRYRRIARAQRKVLHGELTSRAYALRHRQLSESLLEGDVSIGR
jgi:glycosyltransferase involved in cell wall biosynthesis